MQCELCGKNLASFKAEIESVEMAVCQECTKFGNVLSKIQEENFSKNLKESFKPRLNKKISRETEEIVENYGKLIKQAREKLNLDQEELAKKLNEKHSLIAKLENSSIQPSIQLARKLEKQLNITLISVSEEENIINNSLEDAFTIEDFMKNDNKKSNSNINKKSASN